MSAEQNSTPETRQAGDTAGTPETAETPQAAGAAQQGPRPVRLTAAAALAALEGLALVAGGAWMLVEGLAGDPDDRQSAVTGGITLIVLALLPLLAARGLLGRRGWSRGPAVITQIMALPVAYNLLQADSMAIWAGIALAVVAVAALVLLVNPATTQALGIQGPGRSQGAGK
ncbi:hypothetical protein [Streptomyces cellulosae]|uniref:Integral membrane protein n=1 Tax=Streptomyces cellulosae TaxID=1968 RepID=A0ABW7XY04_STRCE